MTATSLARANIALVKYWGKRDEVLNLPVGGSLSLTLDCLATTTTVTFEPRLTDDAVSVGGRPADAPFTARVSRFLDLVRAGSGVAHRARIETHNSFPTGAGLASSASGFAALAHAASRAAGLDLDRRALSVLARRGSGSAARSVVGGIAVLYPGSRPDGEDAFAEQLLGPGAWDLRLVIAVVKAGPKAVSSSEGMQRTSTTSRLYPAFAASLPSDLREAIAAVAARDLERLGEIAERSALELHAAALAARPPLSYLDGATLAGLRAIVELRTTGIPAWFTADAGPQPKAVTDAAHATRVAEALREATGASHVLVCAPGGAVEAVA